MWIARDKSGNLYLYTEKPRRYEFKNVGGAFGSLTTFFKLDNELFSELTWEDEPIEVELVPKGSRIDYLGIESNIERAEEIWQERKN